MRSRVAGRLAVLSAAAGVCGAMLVPFVSIVHAVSAPLATADAQSAPPAVASVIKYWLEPPPPPDAGVVGQGQWLFRHWGCFLCHGSEGRGGVANPNYIKDTIPALNRIADWMLLYDAQDVAVIVDHLKRGTRLDTLVASPPVPRFAVFLAQYHSLQSLIRNGSVPGKKDPRGPTPTLRMPAWNQQLSEADVDAILAYLLTLRPATEPGR